MSGRALVVGFAVLVLSTGLAAAQPAKLSDPLIAHIAYTADEIDIKAAQQALQKIA
jgi:putative membrane protein